MIHYSQIFKRMKNEHKEQTQKATKETILRAIGGMVMLIIFLELIQTVFTIIEFFK